MTAAIGVAGVCCLLRPWLRGALAATVAVAAVAAFALSVVRPGGACGRLAVSVRLD